MYRTLPSLVLLAALAALSPRLAAASEDVTTENATAGLVLDDGERWQMDEHTRTVVADIAATLASADASSIEEIRATGAALLGHQQTLVQGCTMVGPAHDQLHVFLRAWVPALARFREAPDVATGQRELETLRQLLAEYERHFE
jgi:hypothetical protein